jgi:hypothetical protein
MLFHFTAQYAPRGDIGRYSDKRIAAALDWHARPEKLIESLTTTGWVESHPVARLVVHDWSDHADRTTLQRLSRQGKTTIQQNQELTGKVCAQSETNNRTLPEPEPEPEPEPKDICEPDGSREFVLAAPENGNGHGKTKPLKEQEHPQFAAFWDLRWRTDDRQVAARAFRKAVEAVAPALILQAAESHRARELAKEQQFRPMMSTWLNKRRFLDEAEPEQLASPAAKPIVDVKAAILAAMKEKKC